MIIDNVTVSLILGIILIFIDAFLNKEIPDLSTAFLLFISGQSLTYGLFFVLYCITANPLFFFSDRWMSGFGGFALLWIGLDSFVKNIKRSN